MVCGVPYAIFWLTLAATTLARRINLQHVHALKDGIEESNVKLINQVGNETREFSVPEGFIDLSMVAALSEMTDRIALWPQNKPVRSVAAKGTKVPWTGCRKTNCAPGEHISSLHVPRFDKTGSNGEYVLFDIVKGKGSSKVLVFVCGESCPEHRKGVYVAFDPVGAPPNGLFKTWVKKGLLALKSSLKERDFASNVKGVSSKGFGKFYKHYQHRVADSTRAALAFCDEKTGTACALHVTGASMAGHIGIYFAYDLANFKEQNPGDVLFASATGKNRRLDVTTFGAPRSASEEMVQVINKAFTMLRVINEGDRVASLGNPRQGYALDQGGVVMSLPNYLRLGKTVAEFVHDAMCEDTVHSLGNCGMKTCADKTPLADAVGTMKHHICAVALQPNFLQLMRETYLYETGKKHCAGGHPRSRILRSGVDGDMLGVWEKHVTYTCTRVENEHCQDFLNSTKSTT